MNFKISLLTKRAQCSVEYLILFAVIASVALLGLNNLLPRVRQAGTDLVNRVDNSLR